MSHLYGRWRRPPRRVLAFRCLGDRQREGWIAALYGRENANEEWDGFNFVGMCPIYLDAAVSLASFYEAAAYAVWAGKRQPTEPKWEIAARLWKCDTDPKRTSHTRGDGREWTQSAYSAYPRFKAATSAMRGGPFISLTSCIEWRPWIT